MKKIFTKSILALLIIFSFSCEDINEDINANPNDILITDVEDKLFLTGAQLANVQLQVGHLNRISGMYSGQLIGFSSLYSNIYGYNFLKSPFYFVEKVNSKIILTNEHIKIFNPDKSCWASKTPCSYNKNLKLKKFLWMNMVSRK